VRVRWALVILPFVWCVHAAAQGSHRYWRVNVGSTADGSFVSCAELELHTSVGGPNAATGGTAIAGSNFDVTNHPPSKCFDGSASTWWASTSGGISNGTGWIGYDFGGSPPGPIVEIKWTARNDCCFNQSPSAIEIDYSDDSTTWTIAWNQLGMSWSSLGQAQNLHGTADPFDFEGERVFDSAAPVTCDLEGKRVRGSATAGSRDF
jgi:hypothetical protein